MKLPEIMVCLNDSVALVHDADRPSWTCPKCKQCVRYDDAEETPYAVGMSLEEFKHINKTAEKIPQMVASIRLNFGNGV